jgi:hypothetical protein
LPETTLPDGLTALREEMRLSEIMRLIERTARWVDPETLRLLPLWYPEHARRTYFYKKNWSEPQLNKNRQTGHTEHKREGNVHANKALARVLGLRSMTARTGLGVTFGASMTPINNPTLSFRIVAFFLVSPIWYCCQRL